MAPPVSVELSCPLCDAQFQAWEMGHSYYISGIDTDLRETGSVEEVRRYAVTACPSCGFSDFTWDFQNPIELDEQAREKLSKGLNGGGEDRAAPEVPDALRPFAATERCFTLRAMDKGSQAELALLTYYVARDLGSESEAELRAKAAELFAEALDEEEGPGPLSLRYAYLAAELRRLGGDSEGAIAYFDRAVDDGRRLEEEGLDPRGEVDLLGMAQRQRAEVVHSKDSSQALVAVCKVSPRDVRLEVSRILASRRDPRSLKLIPEVFQELEDGDRVAMLRAFADDPHPDLSPLLLSSLRSKNAESIRLAARALGQLGDPEGLEPVLEALERGVLTTEAALVEAVRRLGKPEEVFDRIRELLQRWEDKSAGRAWAVSNDRAPLKNLLYTCPDGRGLALLEEDLKALKDNDLWDKPPFGSPIPAAVSLGDAVVPILPRLLTAGSPAARRWAAHIVCELEEASLKTEVMALRDDPDPTVRLQASKTLTKLGVAIDIDSVLEPIQALDPEEVPFALHFLVPFQSRRVKDWLLELIDTKVATPGEVLPLLGRQEPDDRVRALIEEALVSRDEDARAGGVTALAFIGEHGSGARLEQLFEREHSEAVRRRIIFGLARIGERRERERVVSILKRRFERSPPRLRFSIALALLHLGDSAFIDLVEERAAVLDESLDHYDFVAPAIKALAVHKRR